MTDPIEAMARDIWSAQCDHFGKYASQIPELCEWDELSHSRKNELKREATAAYNALRETLVPVGWMYNYIKPVGDRKHIDPPFALLGQRANMDPRYRTETPLYALPEIKDAD